MALLDKTEKSLNEYKKDDRQQIDIGNIPKAYQGLMGFMKNNLLKKLIL